MNVAAILFVTENVILIRWKCYGVEIITFKKRLVIKQTKKAKEKEVTLEKCHSVSIRGDVQIPVVAEREGLILT